MRSIRQPDRVRGAVEQRHAGDAFALRDLWPAVALLGVVVLGLVIATLYPSGSDDQYAVVAPPWYSRAQTIGLIESIDAGIVDTGGPANMLIIHSSAPGVVRKLFGAGAWLVIDPVQLRGCIGFAQVPRAGRT